MRDNQGAIASNGNYERGLPPLIAIPQITRTSTYMMSRTAIRAAALLAFSLICPRPATAAASEADAEQDRAGNRIEAFEAVPAGPATAEPATKSSAVHCTRDRRWCAQIRTDDQTEVREVVLFDQTKAIAAREAWRYELPPGQDDESFALWPRIVRMPQADDRSEQGVMIGVVTQLHASYSGGGASAGHLSLLLVNEEYGAATFSEVLSVPLNGWVMIRACFSEEDLENRAGACHDEYNFSAELTLHEAKADALPQFNYVTTATSFPGPVSRSADSLSNPPLKEKDLVTMVNDECSYSRVVRFNPATERFEFDLPAPDCSDFTVP